MNNFISKTKKGFSLLEVLIGVSIMAILGGIVIPSGMNYMEKADYNAKKNIVKTVNDALTKAVDEGGFSLPQPVDGNGTALSHGKVGYLNGRGLLSQAVKDLKLDEKGIVEVDGSWAEGKTKVMYVTDTIGKHFAIGIPFKNPDTNITQFLNNTNFPVAKTDDTLFGVKYFSTIIPTVGQDVRQLAIANFNIPEQKVILFFSNMNVDNQTIGGESIDQALTKLKIEGRNGEQVTFSGSAVYGSGYITVGYSGTPTDGMRLTNNNSNLLAFDAFFGAQVVDGVLTQSVGGDSTPTGTCSITSIANGTIGAYPTCAVSCNSGYHVNGYACEQDVVASVNGTCGSLNGTNMTYDNYLAIDKNSSAVCSVGQLYMNVINANTGMRTLTWGCDGSAQGGTTDYSCTATYDAPVVYGTTMLGQTVSGPYYFAKATSDFMTTGRCDNMNGEPDPANNCIVAANLADFTSSYPSLQDTNTKMLIAPYNTIPTWPGYTKQQSIDYCSSLNIGGITGWSLVRNHTHYTQFIANYPVYGLPSNNSNGAWTSQSVDFSSSYAVNGWTEYSLPNDSTQAMGYGMSNIVPFCVKYFN